MATPSITEKTVLLAFALLCTPAAQSALLACLSLGPVTLEASSSFFSMHALHAFAIALPTK